LAVVSEQPPIALTGASTVVTNHGTYTIEASSGTAVNLFDKNDLTVWQTDDGTYNSGDGSYNNVSTSLVTNIDGEWTKITMPYKTILRHVKIESTNSSIKDVTLVGLNADGLTWSNLKTENNLNEETSTIIVNATTHHKTYGLIVRAVNVGRSQAEIGDLKLFTESFSIDGGKVEMASSAIMGGETTVDQHGPHGRGEAKLKKFPEIIFEEGKFDRNDTTNTYTQAGYTVSTDSVYQDRQVYRSFNGLGKHGTAVTTAGYFYSSEDGGGNGFLQASGLPVSGVTFQDENGTSYTGHYIKLELPKKIKLDKINILSYKNLGGGANDDRRPYEGTFLGSNDGINWYLLKTYNNGDVTWSEINYTADQYTIMATISGVINTNYYSYIMFVIEKITPSNAYGVMNIAELKYYGYEEDPPAGDTSVDTTFTSIMNTPQTGGVKVYVDGNTLDNKVSGPDATGPSATYDSTGKYWELNGTLTSNIAVEANTFLEGDQPHAVSVWFNSSNLEANVSNTCVFSISDQEKLDSVNLDLQSNTWHNLTYAYQGEGGSRVTYLDGRKVAEDQAEDTFGEYPPFAMTGLSQGGYVLSTNGSITPGSTNASPHYAFDKQINNFFGFGLIANPGEGTNQTGGPTMPGTVDGSTLPEGYWLKLELPHKLRVNSYNITPRGDLNQAASSPLTWKVYGSNDDSVWTLLHEKTDNTPINPQVSTTNNPGSTFAVSTIGSFKYLALIVLSNDGYAYLNLGELRYYGHRENDLVRLPDPTNVLKYPHIAMTGPAQRGYVVTASSLDVSLLYPAHSAFDEETETEWLNLANQYENGIYIGGETTTENSNTWTGDWLQIQTPNKIRLTSTKIARQFSDTYGTYRSPKQGAIVGSNNGTTWNYIHNWSGLATTDWPSGGVHKEFTFTTPSTAYYKYYRLIVEKNHVGVYNNHISIGSWQLLGTEEATSVPIQIGGGNIDKVANFRVYDKFIGEDQALEIWDAQKDTFRGVKNSVTLHKGRLGIGTTEPEGRLAVLDEPDVDAYGLQEFPPKPLVGYKTHIEGHGEFCVSASVDSSPNYYPSYVFDQDRSSILYWEPLSGGARYSTSSPGDYLKSNRLAAETQLGEYLVLKLPYKIKLEHFTIQRQLGGWWVPQEIYYYAKSEDEDTWEQIYYHGSIFGSYANSAASSDGSDAPIRRDVNSNKFYRYFALVITKGNGGAGVSLADWRLFGYREQLPPKQSVLHDGQLTLTKSLTVPRIGPALDADDTPRRDRLVVEYNTSTNPTFEGAVRDTSGRGNDGVFYGGASYDATEKALVFDGTTSDQYVHTLKNGTSESGNIDYSVSLWFNPTTVNVSRWRAIFAIGVLDRTQPTDNNGDEISLFVNNGTNALHLQNGGSSVNTGALNAGQWVHIVVTYDGVNRKIYLDGSLSVSNEYSSINLPKEMLIRLAQSIPNGNAEVDEYMDCKISNFKTWFGAALTAEEVKTLYDMGRCDEGHHVVNFSKTRVGIGLGDGEAPRAALDVRGSISATGIIRSKRPMWSAGHQPGTSTVLPTMPSNTGIVFENLNYDYTGNYSTSTGHFTAPVSGYYLIGTRALVFVPSDVERVDVEIAKVRLDGSITRVIQGERLAGTQGGRATSLNMSVQISGTVYLVEGEQVYPRYVATGTTTHLVTIANDFNEFWGFLIEQV
jgi:hypothetical protein